MQLLILMYKKWQSYLWHLFLLFCLLRVVGKALDAEILMFRITVAFETIDKQTIEFVSQKIIPASRNVIFIDRSSPLSEKVDLVS